jgi:type VI protein secretion system component VasK
MRNHSYWVGVLAVGLMMTGCAKPPTMEMADAENAMNAAAQAGAADFAANEFAMAQNALTDAREKMNSKDYKAALASAIDAKAKAEAAQAAIAAGKEAAKAAADETIKSVEAKLKDLKTKAAKVKGANAGALKSAVKTIETEWTAVMEDNMNGNYMKVINAASGISGRIDDLSKEAAAPAAAGKPAKKAKK